MTAVPTDVVEAAQFPILVTRDENTLALNIGGHVASGLAQFFLVAQKLPASVENLFPLDLEKTGIEVAVAVDRTRTRSYRVVRLPDMVELGLGKAEGH